MIYFIKLSYANHKGTYIWDGIMDTIPTIFLKDKTSKQNPKNYYHKDYEE